RPLTERFDEWRQRRGEILVLTDTETVARHVDPAAETAFVVVQRDEIGAFVRCEHRWGLRVAVLPDRALDRRPVETVKACADVRHAHTVPWTRPCARCLHCYKGWSWCPAHRAGVHRATVDRACGAPGTSCDGQSGVRSQGRLGQARLAAVDRACGATRNLAGARPATVERACGATRI